jgi:flavoprotein
MLIFDTLLMNSVQQAEQTGGVKSYTVPKFGDYRVKSLFCLTTSKNARLADKYIAHKICFIFSTALSETFWL